MSGISVIVFAMLSDTVLYRNTYCINKSKTAVRTKFVYIIY